MTKDKVQEQKQEMPSNWYRPMNPEMEFSKDNLKKEAKNLVGLEQLVSGIREDSTNPDLFKQAGTFLKQNPSWYSELPNAPIAIRNDLETGLNAQSGNLEKYVTKNAKDALGLLNSDNKKNLLIGIELIKDKAKDDTNEEKKEEIKKYNEFVDVINEVRTVTQIAENPEAKVKYLQAKIKGSDEWAQNMMALYGGNNSYLDRMMMDYMQEANMKIQRILYDDKGKLKEKLIDSYLKKNLILASEENEKNKTFFKVLTKVVTKFVLNEKLKEEEK